jgi:hypothetical protein
MEFPLHKNPKKLIEFFGIIQTEQVPTKVNKDFLKIHNFKSSYDEAIPKIMEQLDFVGSSRIPTDRWKRYRDTSQSKKIMAESIRKTYSELFNVYSNPIEKNKDDLRNFFKGKTTFDDEHINSIIATFEVLCSLADFSQIAEGSFTEPVVDISQSGVESQRAAKIPRKTMEHGQYTVNLNVQLQLPETTNPEVYDKLFESMKKHLFS